MHTCVVDVLVSAARRAPWFLAVFAAVANADQLPNPSIQAAARAYNPSYTAANLFDDANAEYATLSQGAVSAPFTTETTNGTWVELDFGGTVEFDRFVMRSRANTVDIVSRSRLIVSDDPVFDDSDRIFTFDPSGGNRAGYVRHLNQVVSGRYARWEVLTRTGTGLNLGADQLWFLKTPAGHSLLPPPTVINGSTPYDSGYAWEFAVDGDFGREYASQGAQAGVFIDFDFGESKPIAGFEYLNRWSDRVTTFDLVFADDPDFSAPASVQSFTAEPGGNTVTSATFEPVTARYVRLQATGFEGVVNTGVAEIQFFTVSGQAPTITQSPVGGTRLAGDTFTLYSAALGDLPLKFQWLRDRTPVAGATNSSLVFAALQSSDNGDYEVVVSNASGSVTSAPPVTLTVLDPPVDIVSDLRLRLKFDEISGELAIDDSGNARDGTLMGFPGDDSQWVAGRIDGGIRFNPEGDSGDDVVLVSDDGGLDFSTDLAFTVAAWVNGGATQDSGAGLIAKGNGAGGEQFSVDIYNGVFRYYVRDAAGAAVVLQSAVAPNNTWQHVAAVYSATLNRMKLYLNGVEVLSGTPPATLLQNVHEVSFGSRQGGSGAYDLNFNGVMDDARIYGRALTARDITELFNQASLVPPSIVTQPVGATVYAFENFSLSVVADGSPPLTYQWSKNGTTITGATNATLRFENVTTNEAGSYVVTIRNSRGATNSTPVVIQIEDPAPDLQAGLILHLKFDETSGPDALDASGLNHNGVLQGFGESPWTSGLLGGALAFNPEGGAGDDVVLVTDDGSFDFSTTLEFTLAAWVMGGPDQDSGAGLIAKGTGAGGEQYSLDFYQGAFRFYVRDAAAAAVVAPSPVALNHVWQHAAAVFNAAENRMKLFVDGQEVAQAVPPATLLQNSHEVTFGSRQTGGGDYDLNFSGVMDDVRIYSRALTIREIRVLNALGSPPSLTITRTGGTVTLSWPDSFSNFTLEFSEAVPAATWTQVNGVVNNRVTLNVEGTKKFFRLKRAP